MTRKAKKLAKVNNKLDQQLTKENNEIFTDMVVYLRGSNMTEFHQEEVRYDLLQILLEGQQRGDTIEQVIGTDYKAFCDEIITEMPKKTRHQRILEQVSMTLYALTIMIFISVILGIINNVILKRDWNYYEVTWGEVIIAIFVACIANFIVTDFCKRAFEKPFIQNKVLQFLFWWLVCCLIIGGMVVCGLVFKPKAIQINIVIPVLIVVVGMVTSFITENKIDQEEIR